MLEQAEKMFPDFVCVPVLPAPHKLDGVAVAVLGGQEYGDSGDIEALRPLPTYLVIAVLLPMVSEPVTGTKRVAGRLVEIA